MEQITLKRNIRNGGFLTLALRLWSLDASSEEMAEAVNSVNEGVEIVDALAEVAIKQSKIEVC